MNFIPTEDGVCTVSVVGEKANGKFYVDNMQLEKSEAPSNYNLLENSNFEYGTSYGWTLSENASVASDMGVGMPEPKEDATGVHSVYFVGDPQNNAARATQVIQVHRKGPQSYVLSGWAMANAVTDNITVRSDPAYDNTKQFGLRATVVYQNDTENMEFYYVPFNPDVSTWQYASLTVTPERTDLEVDYITISCVYECNANEAWFDNLSLVESTVQTFEYNADGRPITASSTNLSDQTIIYDDSGNVTSVSSANLTTTFEYDPIFTHRLILSSDGFTQTALTHDDVGNVLTTSASSAVISNAKKMVTSSSYTNAGNLISTETNAAGNTTTYGYDDISVSGIAASCDTSSAFYKTFGLPSVVADPSGNEMRYATDTFGRIRQIEAYGKNGNTLDKYASLKYTYGKTLLYEIQRTTGTDIQKYFFLYDKFGNMTDVGIGGWNSTDRITLAEYEYGNGTIDNGLLTGLTYGNEDAVSFTYDNLGRNKTTTYSDGRELTYVYTGDGHLYSIHDSKTGYLYQYTYDSIGRLISGSVKNSAGNILLITRQEYNANNQLVGQHWTIGATTYSETYTYDTADGALTSYNNALGETVVLNYDALRRLSSVVGSKYTKSYTYRNISENNTTTQVAALTYSGFSNAPAFGYTYDALGNITRYTEPTGTQVYTYDAQNQLTKVKDADGNILYQYSYDNAGNILSANGHGYVYSTGLWKDQLASFDGVAFEYDAIGNPTSYYNGTSYTFAWEEGRNLVSAVSGSNTYTYAYDSNGLRVNKTVNGVKHEYLYASGKLLRESYNDITLDFIYDESGYPYALIYKNGTASAQTYYYITNLQGDVLYLLDSNKQEVASYIYDPYGNLQNCAVEGTIAAINPLRYRGYYYDAETGFYYLQSRYFDPAICRFINADNYIATGQSSVESNMYAYCNNGPIVRTDSTGRLPLQAAVEFLYTWLFGDGSPQIYQKNSRISKILKKSDKMKAYFDVAVENYKNGQMVTKGHGEFTAAEDGRELYLSTQHFDYTMIVGRETRTAGILWGEHEEERYTAIIVVHDKYNFDELRAWDSFGNTMNNIAYLYHYICEGGYDFEWWAYYEYSSKWEDVE